MPIKVTAASTSANDAFTFSEDAAAGTLRLNVRANDGKNSSKPLYSLDNGQSADLANGDPISNATASADRSALGAIIWINADGTVGYSASSIQSQIDALAPGETLQDSFLYSVQTTSTAGVWSTVRITFTGTNDAPVAVMDVAAVAEGSVVSGNLGANDRDVDNGAVLSFQSVGSTMQPGFALSSNGAWTFDSNNPAYNNLAAGETRQVVLNYRVTDQYGASSTSSLTVTVTGTNDAPQASVAGSAQQIDEGQVVTGTLFGADPDNNAVLTFSAAGDLPAGVTINADGSYRFDAGHAAYQSLPAGQTVSVTVAYRVTDQHGAGASGAVLFTVRGTNDGPVASSTSASLMEDGQASGQLSATDPDSGDTLSYALTGEAPAGFTLTADGKWQFDASAPAWQRLGEGVVQTISVPFTVSDGKGGSASSTLVLSVTGRNDAATVTGSTVLTLTEDDVYASATMAVNDADLGEAGLADYSYVEGTYGYGYFAPDASGDPAGARWSYEVKDDAAVQALAEGETVTDTFTVLSADGTPLTFTVVMSGANDAPVAEDAAATIAEDGTVTGQLTATDVDHGAVLDFTVDGEAPAGFSLAADGSWSFDANQAQYQALAEGEAMTLTVSYLATDEHGAASSATLTLVVTGTNDGPVTTFPMTEAVEGQVASGQLMAKDMDASDQLTFSVAGDGIPGFALAADGSWTFDTANAAYDYLTSGQTLMVEVPFTVSDGHGGVASARMIVVLTGTNDAPVASAAAASTSEGLVVSGQLQASDPDLFAWLSYELVGEAPAGFTLEADGSWNFDASGPAWDALASGETRDLLIQYRVTDQQGATSDAALTLTVGGANDAPIVPASTVEIAVAPMISGGIEQLFEGQLEASDPEGSTLTYELLDAPDGFELAADGSWTFRTGSDHIKLAQGEHAAVSISYVVVDPQGARTVGSLTLDVVGANDAPVDTDRGTSDPVVVNEKGFVTGQVGGILDVDSGAGLAFSLIAGEPGPGYPYGFSLASDGSWTFDAAHPAYQGLRAGEARSVDAKVLVTDEFGASVLTAVQLQVVGVDDAASVVGTSSTTVTEDGPGDTHEVRIDDPDSGESGTLDSVTLEGTYGVFSLSPTWSGAPGVPSIYARWFFEIRNDSSAVQSLAQGETVTEVFTVTSIGGTPLPFSVTIVGTNDAPVAVASTAEVAEDSVVSGQLAASDVDTGAALSFALTGAAPAGFSLAEDGSWTFDASDPAYNHLAEGQTLVVEVPFTATDEHGASASARLTVAITGSNDAPALAAASVAGAEDAVVSGRLTATDADDGALLTYAADPLAPTAGFSIAADGSWQLDARDAAYQSIAAGEVRPVVVSVLVADEHGATTRSTLTVNLTGSNDGPVVSASKPALASGTEDTVYLLTRDQLLQGWSDPEGNPLTAQLRSAAGTVTNNSDGTWSIRPPSNFAGPMAIDYSVTDGTVTRFHTIYLTFAQVNDAATFSGTLSGSIREDAFSGFITGDANCSDVDNPYDLWRASDWQASANGYGSYRVTDRGVWEYRADNSLAAVNNLNAGQQLVDTITLISADGTARNVSVTIVGRTDWTYATPSVSTASDSSDFDTQGGAPATSAVDLFGTTGNDFSLRGSNFADVISADAGSMDSIYGFGGDDLLYSDLRDPSAPGVQAGRNSVYGGAGNDTIYGGAGEDVIYGGSGSDLIYANASTTPDLKQNTIYGGSGNDTIYAGGVNGDRIDGGTGADLMHSGAGADQFIFMALADTGDTIVGYQQGIDMLDFLEFRFTHGSSQFVGKIGSPELLDPGQIGFMHVNGNTVVYFDAPGTAPGIDFEVTLIGEINLVQRDILA